MHKRIIVIGGVAAGTSAAAKARRMDEKAEIMLFEKGEYISYAGCGLPFYISGVVQDRNELLVQTPEFFSKRHNIEVYVQHEAIEILPNKKMVVVKDLKRGTEKEYKYDKLIIATGAVAKKLPLPGVDYPNIFTLRNLNDADNILKAVFRPGVKNAVIVGAGLIGLEMAESFSHRGLKVTIIERERQVLPSFDFEMAFLVEEHLKKNKISVLTGAEIKEFKGSSQGVSGVILNSGKELPADIVLISVGIKPETKLAERAGIKLGPTGAIGVDSRMETSIRDIFAAGDCAESHNIITGKPLWSPFGSVANRHGRIAGENAAGGESIFRGVVGSSVAKIFDITAAKTGLSEVEALKEGYSAVSVHVHPLNRAHIYPNAEPLSIKVIFDRETEKLLGAQIVGKEGVDKRIDVFTTAIQNDMKVGELFDIDYAYSPPYAPAKDPAAVAGAVANNALKSGVKFLSPQKLKEKIQKYPHDIMLVDVREPHELEDNGYIKSAVNIPLNEVRNRLGEFDDTKEIVFYCRQGLRGYLAAKVLVNLGFKNVSNLSGGLLNWPYQELIVFEKSC